jgi:hypothetical protein
MRLIRRRHRCVEWRAILSRLVTVTERRSEWGYVSRLLRVTRSGFRFSRLSADFLRKQL